MKITYRTLCGEVVSENLNSNILEHRSKLHLEARRILTDCFPLSEILEEPPIRIFKKEIAYFDFLMPREKLCVEVQGQQHYTYSDFFHGNKRRFFKQIQKDNRKKEWAELNGFRFLALRFDEEKEWQTKIYAMK